MVLFVKRSLLHLSQMSSCTSRPKPVPVKYTTTWDLLQTMAVSHLPLGSIQLTARLTVSAQRAVGAYRAGSGICGALRSWAYRTLTSPQGTSTVALGAAESTQPPRKPATSSAVPPCRLRLKGPPADSRQPQLCASVCSGAAAWPPAPRTGAAGAQRQRVAIRNTDTSAGIKPFYWEPSGEGRRAGRTMRSCLRSARISQALRPPKAGVYLPKTLYFLEVCRVLVFSKQFKYAHCMQKVSKLVCLVQGEKLQDYYLRSITLT